MGEMADLALDQMFDPEFGDWDEDQDRITFDDCIWFPRRLKQRKGINIDVEIASIIPPPQIVTNSCNK